MTTRAGLRDMIRESLSDRGAWPDATLNGWINAAIRDYNAYFVQQSSATINCVAGTRTYSLSAYPGIAGILQVEFPAGETPPRYLARRPETGSFYGLAVYDLRGDPPETLVLGEEPATGDTIAILYSHGYAELSDDSDVLGIPDQHLEALKEFVKWQAIKELEMNEAIDPDRKDLLLSMLGLNAVRAERIYRSKIREYLQMAAPGGYAGPWRVDGFDPVY